MIRLRLARWLVLGFVLAVVAGCGSKPARVLSPTPKDGAPSGLALALSGLPGGVPPTVQITCPRPSPLFAHVTPPALRIVWEGSDPDGQSSAEPVEYKYILLGPGSEFPVALALSDPDSLRRYYVDHPQGPWAGWDSTATDSTEVRLGNLIPESEYVFAVIAFDETGLYSPLFSYYANLLHLRITYAGDPGSNLTIAGPGFEHEFIGWRPFQQVHIQVEEGRPMTFDWFSEPRGTCDGIVARSYRWALDIADLFDETPRKNEETDLEHWSQKSRNTSATLPPFRLSSPPATEDHYFYVEVDDIVGDRGLGTVRITVVPSTNRPPDCSAATAQIPASWPADGSLAAVSISGVTDPDGDPLTIAVTEVTQDEPVDGAGYGSTCPDAMIVDGAAQVRRERAGSGNGRVYTIRFTADDGRGGTCEGAAEVCIPHDRGGEISCIKDDFSENSLGACDGDARRAGRGRSTLPPGDQGR